MKRKPGLFRWITGLILLVTLSGSGGKEALRMGGFPVKAALAAGGGERSPLATRACPALPPPAGSIIPVATVPELEAAVNSAVPGTTILAADGTYALDGVYLRFDTPGVTLRSASGNRQGVILDGNYLTTEIIQITASNVTIADLTLQEAYYHPIHVMSTEAGDTLNTLIYNVRILDPGEQAIKINPAAEGTYPDEGVIACSHIELTDTGRPHIRNNCYTGGVDAHQARGWVIRDNFIAGFWCPSGLSEHGIHLWRGSRATLVERNILADNARGIGFGLATDGDGRTYPDDPCPQASGYVDHFEGLIRNNFVFASNSELFASQAGFDCGICLWNSCRARVLNNTVYSTQAPFSSIEWRFPNTVVDIFNNLVNYPLRERDSAQGTLLSNLTDAQADWFVNAAAGDLHLVPGASEAIDQAAPQADVSDDIDGEPRPGGAAPDIGADELVPALALSALPASHSIRLSWTVNAALPVGSTWEISYLGPPGDQPSPIRDLPGNARAFTLTGLTNGALYTVTLNAMLDETPILAATVTAMPAGFNVHLPLAERAP